MKLPMLLLLAMAATHTDAMPSKLPARLALPVTQLRPTQPNVHALAKNLAFNSAAQDTPPHPYPHP